MQQRLRRPLSSPAWMRARSNEGIQSLVAWTPSVKVDPRWIDSRRMEIGLRRERWGGEWSWTSRALVMVTPADSMEPN